MAKISADFLTDESSRVGGDTSPRIPIRIPKTAELIADQIRKRIIQGELKENDFLPNEVQLMASLGISRPTLREAFRILEAEMLISVVRGSRTGARVHTPRIETVSRYAGFVLQSQKTTIRDIYEARLAIEPFVARRLAEERPATTTVRLREQVAKLTALVEAGQYVDFMIGLAEFHRVLVEESGNKTLLLITSILQEIVARYQVEFLRKRNLDEVTQRERALWGLRSFHKLIAFIEAGDADRAESHWRLHLRNANRAWVEAIDPEQTIDAFE